MQQQEEQDWKEKGDSSSEDTMRASDGGEHQGIDENCHHHQESFPPPATMTGANANASAEEYSSSSSTSTRSPEATDQNQSRRTSWRPRVRFNSSAAAAKRQEEEEEQSAASDHHHRHQSHYVQDDYTVHGQDGYGYGYEDEVLPEEKRRYSATMEAMQRAQNMAMSVDADDDDDDDETEAAGNGDGVGGGGDNNNNNNQDSPKQDNVDLEKNVQTEEVTHTTEAEALWQAHKQQESQAWGAAAGESYHPTETEAQPSQVSQRLGSPDDGYTVTGNARGGIFYHLLQTYKQQPPMYSTALGVSLTPESRSHTPEPGSAPTTTAATPTRRKWYDQEKDNRSQETLAQLIGASRQLANPNEKKNQSATPPQETERGRLPLGLGGHKRNATSESRAQSKIRRILQTQQQEDETRIKRHVAGILLRQRYLIKMCRALMLFGAPTHRLEEYLATTASALSMDSQFLYIPGCMIISFDDALTHTTEVKIVRTTQGVNLGKLKDLHHIYKEVLHDCISLDEAMERLEGLMTKGNQHPVWVCVLCYGLCSMFVSCFFSARPVDFPVIFLLGTMLGVLQLVVAPLSKTYSTVFEVSSAILITFISRAVASVKGGDFFCFSAIAQGSIAMILPGWLVLSSALELQSKAIVPGSIRMVYAVIYSLFLGYGITVGTALYGAMDPNATTKAECNNAMNPHWNFLFVPLYLFFLTFTVQAKWKQMPVMIAIAFCGYIVNFYTSTAFSASAPIAYTFGAFAVGVLANLYSRLRHGVAAAVLLPAVYVQVPGSLAASGAIASGLRTAKNLNDPSPVSDLNNHLNGIVFNVAASMIQIAIGITVGLFMSALVIYPLGKRRSGLWTL